jgi:CRISPR-associated protein Cas5d
MFRGIKLYVWGDFACFTRPEMKVERVSYDILTPSAARGILEAIYWKPQFEWKIDKIHLLKPIRYTSLRRNEVKDKVSADNARKAINGSSTKLGIEVEHSRVQRASLILRDIAYGIEASIKIRDYRFKRGEKPLSENECVGKHLAQFERRARAGAHFQQPYFGTREFPAACQWIDQDQNFPAPDESIPESDLNKELGYMLHDFTYEESNQEKGTFIESNEGKRIKAIPRFMRAQLVDGILDVNRCLEEAPLTA